MISGFYRPTSGTIALEGRDITYARPSAIATLGVARMFQNIALFAGMTVPTHTLSVVFRLRALPRRKNLPIAPASRN